MSAQGKGKKTITCILCGGVHIYPGPRFGNHLLHEHGIVFNQEYIVEVSLYKSIHNNLPPIITGIPKTVLNQSSQTDLSSQATCSQCARPVNEFLTSTPIRKRVFHNPKYSSQPADKQSTSSYLSTPETPSYTKVHSKSNKLVKFTHEAPPEVLASDLPAGLAPDLRAGQAPDIPAGLAPDLPAGQAPDLPAGLASDLPAGLAPDLPARSGFQCKCALCNFVTTDDTTFWRHVTKNHGLNFKKYKDEHGTCQTAIGSGMFECFICQASMKHMPCGVDKHLKKQHGLNWLQYLARIKEERYNKPNGLVGTEALSDLTMEESHDHLQLPEQTVNKSRPLNIKDKTNTFCSYCVVTFNTRMMFLKHCRDIHNLKFKTRSGAPVDLDKTSSSVKDDRQLMLNPSRKPSPSMNSPSASAHQSYSTQDMAVSSSRKKPGEGAFPCEHCNKRFSSYSNMERHTRLSCPMRGGSDQKVIPVNVKPDSRVEAGAGFKCRKCARVFTKLGNLNRHYISSCFSPSNQ